MRAVVTGAAGFIGSHLCDRLLAGGHSVAGIDCFSDYYSRTIKERNLESVREHPDFEFSELDLVDDDLRGVLEGAELIFHFAGRSGIRPGRRNQFDQYVRDNILGTQRLLEAVSTTSTRRFVYASSSSVYGDAERLPTKENTIPSPLSAYGVTKLAAENLVRLYSLKLGVPAVALRLFHVYGPRQRPDMAIARFMRGLWEGDIVDIHGDGEQSRDLIFVADAVDATVAAASAPVAGKTFNIGGGSRATLNAVLETLEEITGAKARRRYLPEIPEEHRHGGASINLARQQLPWEPRVSLRDGLSRQWAWFQRTAETEGRRTMVAV